MPGLIILGIIVEMIKLSWINVGFLSILLLINGLISWQEERSADLSLESIADKLSESACVKRDGLWINIPARELVIGDRLKIVTGDIILADCIVNKGHCEVDQSCHVPAGKDSCRGLWPNGGLSGDYLLAKTFSPLCPRARSRFTTFDVYLTVIIPILRNVSVVRWWLAPASCRRRQLAPASCRRRQRQQCGT